MLSQNSPKVVVRKRKRTVVVTKCTEVHPTGVENGGRCQRAANHDGLCEVVGLKRWDRRLKGMPAKATPGRIVRYKQGAISVPAIITAAFTDWVDLVVFDGRGATFVSGVRNDGWYWPPRL